MFEDAIRDVLVADSTLTAMLSTFTPRGGGTAAPAIFTQDPVPENAALPYVVVAGPISDEPFDAKGEPLGRDALIDIRCYTARTGSVSVVTQIASRVRTLLHRQEVAVTGLAWIETILSGPIKQDEDETYGRVLNARLMYSGA